MSNYDGKIEPLPRYSNQGNEHYLSSDKPDTYLWLAEENTKQAKKIELLQKKLDIALDTLGQIAKFSTDLTNAVQCGVAIQEINEIDGVKDETLETL